MIKSYKAGLLAQVHHLIRPSQIHSSGITKQTPLHSGGTAEDSYYFIPYSPLNEAPFASYSI